MNALLDDIKNLRYHLSFLILFCFYRVLDKVLKWVFMDPKFELVEHTDADHLVGEAEVAKLLREYFKIE